MLTTATEKRLFERFPARFPAKFHDTSVEYGLDVFLRNFSATGAHFLTRERAYLDDVVSVDVKVPDEFEPVAFNGRVRWSRQTEMQLWDVGVEFHKVNLMRLHRIMKHLPPQE